MQKVKSGKSRGMNHVLATVATTSPYVHMERLVEQPTNMKVSTANPDKSRRKKKFKKKHLLYKANNSNKEVKHSSTHLGYNVGEEANKLNNKSMLGSSYCKLKQSVVELTNCNDETDKNLTIILDKAQNLVLEVSNLKDNHKPSNNNSIESNKKKRFYFGPEETESSKGTANSNKTPGNCNSKKIKNKFKNKFKGIKHQSLSEAKVSSPTENLAVQNNVTATTTLLNHAAKKGSAKCPNFIETPSCNIKNNDKTDTCTEAESRINSLRTYSRLKPDLSTKDNLLLRKTKKNVEVNCFLKNSETGSRSSTILEKNSRKDISQTINADNIIDKNLEKHQVDSISVGENNLEEYSEDFSEKLFCKKKFKKSSLKNQDVRLRDVRVSSRFQDTTNTNDCKINSNTKEFSTNVAYSKLHTNLKCHVSLKRLSAQHEAKDIIATNVDTVNLKENTLNDDTSDLSQLDDKNITITDSEKGVDTNANTLTAPTVQKSPIENTDQITNMKEPIPQLVNFPADGYIEQAIFNEAIESLLVDLEVSKIEMPLLSNETAVDTHIVDKVPRKDIECEISNEDDPCTQVTSKILTDASPVQTCVESKLSPDSDEISLPSCIEDASSIADTCKASCPVLEEPSCTDASQISPKDAIAAPISDDTHVVSKPALDAVDFNARRRNPMNKPALDTVDFNARRRNPMTKPSGDGEISEKCCGHFYPSNKSYINHLMSATDEETSEMHKAVLIQLDMAKCKECKKWVKTSALPKHLRRMHNIRSTLPLASMGKSKDKAALAIPVIQSVCSLKSNSMPCPLSKKKDQNGNNILCHLTGNKSLSVSCVSDLPFSMKPIVMLKKSLSPYKSTAGFKSVPRIIKVESLSTKRTLAVTNDDVLGKVNYPKGDHLNALLPKKKKKKASSQKVTSSVVESSVNAEKTGRLTKPNGKLKNKSKFCYSDSVKKAILPLSEKNRCITPARKGKAAPKKNGKTLKKVQFSNGYFLQDSSDDLPSSTSSSSDSSEDEENNKENNDSVPTVELDLFTLPATDEDDSVFLTDPTNPDFKVFASMDAIFVGDAELAQPSAQIGYVTDTNNVVYINPEHFLFPNLENDLDKGMLSSDINLDSVKLSAKDIEALSQLDHKKSSPLKAPLNHLSPLKHNLPERAIISPLKGELKSNIIKSLRKRNFVQKDQSPSKHDRQASDLLSPVKVTTNKSNSPLKLSVLRNKSFNIKQSIPKASKVINIRKDQLGLKKTKIDPIKKALGLVTRNSRKEEALGNKVNDGRAKVCIGKPSKFDTGDDRLAFEEFFIDSDDISIVENDINEIDESICITPQIMSDEPNIRSERETKPDRRETVNPIVIKVGRPCPVLAHPNNPHSKYIITVHNSLNKSLLKQYPNYWASTNTSRKPSNFYQKGNFSYDRSTESFQSHLKKTNPKFNKNNSAVSRFKHPKNVKVVSMKPRKHVKVVNTPIPDVIPTVQTESLVDTINIDPNSDVVDLPFNFLDNGTLADVTPAVDNIFQGQSKNATQEKPTKDVQDEYVFLDEKGILRSPSGRDLNSANTDFDEAFLINMIENYAENLVIPNSPTVEKPENNFGRRPPLAQAPKSPQNLSDPLQQEKYLDILKGKSAWDTQLLFSPSRSKGTRNSSTDTISDNGRDLSWNSPQGNRLKRKQSDVDLFNIPLSEIPDLLSPRCRNSQNKFLLNSPVALSPNTLSAVLSPKKCRTPSVSHLSPKSNPELGRLQKIPSSSGIGRDNNISKHIALKDTPPSKRKRLFSSPVSKKAQTNRIANKHPKKHTVKPLSLQKKTTLVKPAAKAKINKETKPRKRSRSKTKNEFAPVDKSAAILFQSDDEADFCGFDTDETAALHNIRRVYLNALKARASPKKKRKSVNLKISFKNPNFPVVLPRTPSTSEESDRGSQSVCLSSAKRKRSASDNSRHSPPKKCLSDSDDDKPLQAIVLKNFMKSPTNISRAPIRRDSDKKYVKPRPKSKIQVRPLQDLQSTDLRTELCAFTPSGKKIDDASTNVPSDHVSPELVFPVGPYSRTKLKPLRRKRSVLRDIRSFFSSKKPPNSAAAPNTFKGFAAPNTFKGFATQTSASGSAPLKKVKKAARFNATKPKSSCDIRNYMSVEQTCVFTASERTNYLQKRYEFVSKLQQDHSHSVSDSSFDGFESNFEEGEAKLKTLQTYVDVLNMQNMFCTNDYSLSLDSTCAWDEKTINHELELF